MNTVTLSLPSPLTLQMDLTDEQFFQLCQDNTDYLFERTAKGELIIMSPTGSDTGNRNIELAYQLQAWSRQNQLGKAFDSSTGFKLPNGAERSPDASWIAIERWNKLTSAQQGKFAPLCPDFVVELRSASDALKKLQEKMLEYIDNGAKLGWLLDRKKQQVEIYRPQQSVEILRSPKTLSGENVLPNFVLDLKDILY
ncbi:MAG: Uma2 family endonuclease [Cyanobacteria bacterium J06592_8]